MFYKDLAGLHVEQMFMIEVFAGGAVLCSVAKSYGLNSSIAIDKVKKPNARSTILQLNLLLAEDRTLLETWLESPLLAWVHLAPVCGTASFPYTKPSKRACRPTTFAQLGLPRRVTLSEWRRADSCGPCK